MVSALCFGGYGMGCLLLPGMRREFERFGLPRMRVLTGLLQLGASVGLVAGFWWPPLGMLSALGLSGMMVVATVVRIRIGDPWSGRIQALGCLVLNGCIAIGHLVTLF